MLKNIVALVLAAPLSVLALPIPVNQLVVFGDSLSDYGNASIFSGGPIPGSGTNYATTTIPGVPFPVYFYTDGPNTNPATSSPTGLWINQFAAGAGLPNPLPSLAGAPGSTDFAFGSAQSGTTNPQDVGNQVASFLSLTGGVAPPSNLYVFWAGANDIFNGNSGATAANNVAAEIQALAGAGGKYFMWLNLPPLGDTPAAMAQGSTAVLVANAQSAAFNTTWASDIASLDSLPGVQVIGVDVNSLFNSILANPGLFGLTDVTHPSQGSAVDPNQYLFWDALHPTTAGDALVANLALTDLNAVPEPATFTLLLSGLACAGFLRLRRRVRSPQSSDHN